MSDLRDRIAAALWDEARVPDPNLPPWELASDYIRDARRHQADAVLAVLQLAGLIDAPEPSDGDELLTEFSGAALETFVQTSAFTGALRWGRVGAAVLEIHLRELRAQQRRTLRDVADLVEDNAPRSIDRGPFARYLRSDEALGDLLRRRAATQ